jgi:type II secretory pathway component GspD/PulD (secretin)
MIGSDKMAPVSQLVKVIDAAKEAHIQKINMFAASNTIASKLTGTRLDRVSFDRLPLSEVLKNLADQTRKLDPDGHGVNFVIAPDSADAGSAVINVAPELVDIRLTNVLDVIVKVADKPLKYSIGAEGVTFSLKYPKTEPLVTRTYHLDPDRFRQGLKKQGIVLENSATNVVVEAKPQAGVGSGSVSPNTLFGGAGSAYVKRPLPAELVSLQVREFFISLGLDLSTNSGKALVYNSHRGELLVKATVADLTLIEHTINVVCAAPHINLKVQFIEIDRSNNATNRPDWLPAETVTSFTTNAARKLSDPQLIATPSGDSAFDPAKLPRSPTNSIITQFQGLLTRPQAQVVIHALQQREGADVLATPDVPTDSGRQSQITVTQARTIVTGLDSGKDANGAVTNNYRTQNIQCGDVLDAIPRVLADGSIEVSVTGTVTEFLGYDDPHAPAFKKEVASGSPNAKFPLPRFCVRQMTTKTTAQDGQTIVLGGFVGDSVAIRTVNKIPVLGDLPLLGHLFTTTTVRQVKKDLVILITPTILQPDGSRVHPESAATTAAEPAPK